MQEKGNLSINSENFMPIIKKWLYSDTDIFVRELVSNGADAINKLQRLVAIGEANIADDEQYYIRVVLDKENKTITFIDNGIGMTADEVKRYINQIAFSGATEFVNKYKDKTEAGNEIIGHFGLGFYSAFMAAAKVQIDTLSYQDGSVAARWISDGGTEYEMEDSEKTTRGTEITLFVSEDSEELLDDYKLRSILKKYCSFIPVDIFFENAAIKDEELKGTEPSESGDDEAEVQEPKKPEPINNKNPLWTREPKDCTDEDYKRFYHQVFMDFNEPLFWIHLNMDYPFRLKGILYFPKLKHELESIEGQVKLYSNQVFIADNIKEVIPEFLLLLKGVMDCPDLPLNVSRSFLQNDGYVAKMSSYITKKVADKLTSLAKKQRDDYNKYWDDINQFIKYGCIRENDFYDKCKAAVLYKSTKDEYLTLEEYLDRNEPKAGKKVYYASNSRQQVQYLRLFDDQGIDAVLMETKLDTPFMSFVESKEEGLSFARVDSGISDAMKSEDTPADEKKNESISELFKKSLDMDSLKVRVENLKAQNVPAVILLSEADRRMQDMSAMYGVNFGMPEAGEELVVNAASPLISSLAEISGQADREEDVKMICQHVYDLAMLSHKPLSSEEMGRFIERSNDILSRIATDK